MKKIVNPLRSSWASITERPIFQIQEIQAQVRPILERVKKEGDDALREYTEQFDGVNLDKLYVDNQEIQAGLTRISVELKNAISTAAKNINDFHIIQKDPVRIAEVDDGVTCWQKSVPIEKVGLYIPGGTAPLFSTLLMLAIPAKIAGCKEIVVCSPPNKEGSLPDPVLATAAILGISRIYLVGGAQAIAAMAYGTNTIPAVHKIFGPGNQYVTAAKQLVVHEGVAMDLPAGPSELMVVAGDGAHPAYLAADLLSQAEHGVDSQVILTGLDLQLLSRIEQEVNAQLETLPRKEIARQSLAQSWVVSFDNLHELFSFVNDYAPEHLILASNDASEWEDLVSNAGSVFMGHYTPESAGDYASGTNHTLPTNGYAKTYSGINLDAYVKKITFQQITKNGIEYLGPHIIQMAEAEHLHGHARAVQLRINDAL